MQYETHLGLRREKNFEEVRKHILNENDKISYPSRQGTFLQLSNIYIYMGRWPQQCGTMPTMPRSIRQGTGRATSRHFTKLRSGPQGIWIPPLAMVLPRGIPHRHPVLVLGPPPGAGGYPPSLPPGSGGGGGPDQIMGVGYQPPPPGAPPNGFAGMLNNSLAQALAAEGVRPTVLDPPFVFANFQQQPPGPPPPPAAAQMLANPMMQPASMSQVDVANYYYQMQQSPQQPPAMLYPTAQPQSSGPNGGGGYGPVVQPRKSRGRKVA